MSHDASTPTVHGLMAEFDSPEALVHAAENARLGGYRKMDAYTPIPIEELDEALGLMNSFEGCETIRVNSLHGQGILEPGKRIVIEGVAEDGTIEAIRIADAQSFALGVQWHAEYDPQKNPINRKLFEAFGEALAQHNRAA